MIKFLSILLLTITLLAVACSDDSDDPGEIMIPKQDCDKMIVKTAVSVAAVGLNETIGALFLEDTPDSTIAEFCQIFIEPVRFLEDSSGYFFVENMDAVMKAHAVNKDLIGQNRCDRQDSKGKYYVREMVDSVNERGGGFVEYYFVNPANGLEEMKNSYVKHMPVPDYFIGAGYYVWEDWLISEFECKKKVLETAVHCAAAGMGAVAVEAETDMRETFFRVFVDKIRFFEDNSGYFFVYKTDGLCVALPAQKEFEGVNRYDATDSRGAYFVRHIIDLVESSGKGYYEYYYYNAVDDKDEKKLSYIEAIPGTDYFIGAGIYSE